MNPYQATVVEFRNGKRKTKFGFSGLFVVIVVVITLGAAFVVGLVVGREITIWEYNMSQKYRITNGPRDTYW